jgi:hypothetical protein
MEQILKQLHALEEAAYTKLLNAHVQKSNPILIKRLNEIKRKEIDWLACKSCDYNNDLPIENREEINKIKKDLVKKLYKWIQSVGTNFTKKRYIRPTKDILEEGKQAAVLGFYEALRTYDYKNPFRPFALLWIKNKVYKAIDYQRPKEEKLDAEMTLGKNDELGCRTNLILTDFINKRVDNAAALWKVYYVGLCISAGYLIKIIKSDSGQNRIRLYKSLVIDLLLNRKGMRSLIAEYSITKQAINRFKLRLYELIRTDLKYNRLIDWQERAKWDYDFQKVLKEQAFRFTYNRLYIQNTGQFNIVELEVLAKPGFELKDLLELNEVLNDCRIKD